jgi:hypothetical protein
MTSDGIASRFLSYVDKSRYECVSPRPPAEWEGAGCLNHMAA